MVVVVVVAVVVVVPTDLPATSMGNGEAKPKSAASADVDLVEAMDLLEAAVKRMAKASPLAPPLRCLAHPGLGTA